MKRLIWLAFLLPYFATAQINGTIQKTPATGLIRGTFGSSGINNLGLSESGGVSTGWISGGVLTAVGDAAPDISAGVGYVYVTASDSYTRVAWNAVTDLAVTNNAVNYISVNSSGVVSATITPPTHTDQRTAIQLGRVSMTSGVISGITSTVVSIKQTAPQIYDLFKAIGPVKSGLALTAVGGNLKIAVASGEIYSQGVSGHTNVNSPNEAEFTGNNPQTFRMFTQLASSGGDVTDLPVGSYDNAGTVTAIPGAGSQATIFTVYKFSSGNVRTFYGQSIYTNLNAAVQAIGSYVPVVPASFADAIIIGYIAATKNATDLSQATQATFIATNRFGGVGGAIASAGSFMFTDFSNATGTIGVANIDTTAIRTVANSVSLAGLQTRLNAYVALTGNQTISGFKTFSSNILLGSTASDLFLSGTATSSYRRGLFLTDAATINMQIYTGGSATIGAYTEGVSTMVYGTGPAGGGGGLEKHVWHSTGDGNQFAIDGTANRVTSYYPMTVSGSVTSTSFIGELTGNASTATTASSVTNGVYTVGNQSISGNKTFESNVLIDNGSVLQIESGTSGFYANFQPTTLTANRSFTFPNTSGTVALTSDLSGYLPLSGGTLTNALKIEGTTNPSLYLGSPTGSGGFVPSIFHYNSAGTKYFGTYLNTAGTYILYDGTSSIGRLEITQGGAVSIGGALSLGGVLTATNAVLTTPSISGKPTVTGGVYGEFFNGTANTLMFDNGATAATTEFTIRANGSGGVNLTSGATSWASSSDENTKVMTEWKPFVNPLDKITSLRAGTSRYKTDSIGVSRSFLIAQDVQKVLPEAVYSNDKGELSLRYSDVIPLLVSALQEEKAKREALEKKFTELEERIKLLELKP